MDYHYRTGTGPEISKTDLEAIGQAEFDRLTKTPAPTPAADDVTPTHEGDAQ